MPPLSGEFGDWGRRASSHEARNRTELRSLVRKVYKRLVHVAPSPTVGRIVALHDRMPRFTKVRRRMSVGRLVATPDMATQPAESQVDPRIARFEAFLASPSAGRHVPNQTYMWAMLGHRASDYAVAQIFAHKAVAGSVRAVK